MAGSPLIEIQGLHKSFGKLEVLKDINLCIERGTAVALLGPNASGKTTLFKSLLGLIHPNRGSILIEGVSHSNPEIRRKIAYVPQHVVFPESLTVAQLIEVMQDIRGQRAHPTPLLELFSLASVLPRKIKTLSGGTYQKVNILSGLMFEETEILVLDEPSVGLDPPSRIKFREWLKNKRNEGLTILFSSHIIEDLEELCERIIFILEGKIYYDGTPSALLKKYNQINLERAIAYLLSEGHV